MKRHLLVILFFTIIASMAFADDKATDSQKRSRWDGEIRRAKAEYVAREIKVSDEQKAAFIALYEKMNQEMDQLREDTRKMEQSVMKKGDAATDLEYEKATEAMIQLPGRQSEIEAKYYKEFSTMASTKQLFQIKGAERKFTHMLMKHRKHLKKD